MSLKDAAKYIEDKSPNNVSGSIKKALKLSQNLKKSKGNPKMQDAVGPSELASMLAEVAQAFSQPAQGQTDICAQLQQQLTALRNYLNQLLAMTPQTPELKASEDEIQISINVILQQMKQNGCPITNG
jgi:hypothetical protein